MDNPLSFAEYQKRIKSVATQEEAEALIQELIAPALKKLGTTAKLSRPAPAAPEEMPVFPQYQAVTTTISRVIPKISLWRDVVDSDNEDMVVNLYAKGMNTRDIAGYMRNYHKMELTQNGVSEITDKVFPLIREWQTRPLSEMYPVVYLDGMRFKVRDNGKIMNKVANIVMGINQYGIKEVLGIWVSDTEGAKFWMQVLNEIKQRGVEDILFACVDGLKGFPEAIREIYPETEVQQCIVHQIRHTMKFVMHKDKDKFCASLREVYTAPTDEAGFRALQSVQEKWPQYLMHLKSWENNWPELAPFFQYPEPIRKLIYTTNPIENLNGQFRKVTKTTVVFPHNDSLLKLLWLAQADISQKWTTPLSDWRSMMAQLHILFPERMQF